MKRESAKGPAKDEAHRDTRGWLGILLGYASKCRGRMILAEVLSVASVFLGLVPFYAVYRIIEVVAVTTDDIYASWDAILFWSVVSIASYVLQHIFFGLSTINAHISAYTILGTLREGVATKLMNASLGTAQDKTIGNLKNLVVDKIEKIEIPLAHMIPELSANLLLALAIAIWLAIIDWRIALSCLLTVLIGLLVMGLGMQNYYKMYDGYLKEQDRVNSVVVEYIEGIRVVKAFNQATNSYKKFSDAVSSFLKFTLNWMKSSWIPQHLAMSIIPTTLLGVAPVGILLFEMGDITAPEFGLSCVLALAVVTPVTYLGASFNEINLISYAIADAREFLDLPELPQPAERAVLSGAEVKFDDVHFSYREGKEALSGVSIEAFSGSFVALVGPSGSGKSTIARLIARHWDVDSGSITIGGVDVRSMPLSQLSDLVSYVSQDDYLLDGTLLDNIRMGRPDATEEEVMAAAQAASCEEFIKRLPQGWDTPSGEAGRMLSGGERQRVCIARAILKDAPIVVFDEATAFADPENEARIQRSVAQLSKGKTLIVIAHRLSTIVAANTIYVIEDGSVVAQGGHDDLLGECKLYSSMWEAHTGASAWAVGDGGASEAFASKAQEVDAR